MVPEPGKICSGGKECKSNRSKPIFIAMLRSATLRGTLPGKSSAISGCVEPTFGVEELSVSSGRVATMHIIDWLGSSEARSIGINLMRLSHQGGETQFGLGVSPSALAVGERAGYRLRGLVPVYTRVLRVGYWLRKVGPNPLERALQLARDLVGRVTRLPGKPRVGLKLERVSIFGSEICEIAAEAEKHAVMTQRDPARLNAFLRFPRQDFSGWYLRDETGRLRGFAL